MNARLRKSRPLLGGRWEQFRWFAFVAAALFLQFMLQNAAMAAKRVALVVGNSAYLNAPKLPNPENDSSAIGSLFKKIGFDTVVVANNVGNLDFKRAIRKFEDASADADISVVFFAGHGVEIGGVNYLLPVDARLASDRDASDEAITLDRLIESVETAKQLRLIILDACRDNPFVATMKRTSRTATRGIASGLGKVEPTNTDTLIAYAAKGGSTAEDGEGTHSPFTRALLSNLSEPGLDIRLAFGRVRDEVIKATARRQEPFVYGSLGGGNVSLVPSSPTSVETAKNHVKTDYELVAKVGTRRAWEVFLNTHGSGFYADLARAQLAKLSEGEPLADPVRPAKPSAEEERAWAKIKNSTSKTALEAFIRRYPSSPLAVEAQGRVDDLDRSLRERAEKLRMEREAAEIAAEERRVREAARRAEAELSKKTATEAERQRIREQLEREKAACDSDREQLERLRASDASVAVRDDLKKLSQETTCVSLRPQVLSALNKVTNAIAKDTAKPEPDTRLVATAQKELARLGCYSGSNDGKFNAATKIAIKNYHLRMGEPADQEINELFVEELGKQRLRVCPVTVAEPKQEKPRKPTVSKSELQAPKQTGRAPSAILGVGF